MVAISSTVSEKYQVVIPKEVRQRLDLHPHDTLLFLIDDNDVVIRPKPASFTAKLLGLHKEIWADEDVDIWLQQERATWE